MHNNRTFIKNIAYNLILVIFSCFLSLFIFEIYLRIARNPDFFYMKLQKFPELATEGWQRRFIKDYERRNSKGFLGHDLNEYLHDPYLGWDTPGRIRGDKTYSLQKPEGAYRIITIGDSFTWGSEVNVDQTFSAYLEKLIENGEVINMGVRAYGIGQAALKFLQHGLQYKPDMLIFCIFAPDYERTAVPFFRFAKPLYKIDKKTGELVLTNVPVPKVKDVYEKLKSEIGPMSYAYAALRQEYIALGFKEDISKHNQEYHEEWDKVIEKIFQKLLDVGKKNNIEILFMYIPIGPAFKDDATLNNEKTNPLLKIFKKLSLPQIDLTEEIPNQYSRQEAYEKFFIWNNGSPEGHFTPEGNRKVAQIMYGKIKTLY